MIRCEHKPGTESSIRGRSGDDCVFEPHKRSMWTFPIPITPNPAWFREPYSSTAFSDQISYFVSTLIPQSFPFFFVMYTF